MVFPVMVVLLLLVVILLLLLPLVVGLPVPVVVRTAGEEERLTRQGG